VGRSASKAFRRVREQRMRDGVDGGCSKAGRSAYTGLDVINHRAMPPADLAIEQAVRETLERTVAARAAKLGVMVSFDGWPSATDTRWMRVRCGLRTTVVDTRVAPSAFDAALRTFAAELAA
jgi:hypothetical protein